MAHLVRHRLLGFLLVRLEVVNPADAVQHVEPQIGFITQPLANFHQSLGRHFDPGVDVFEIAAHNFVAKL